ncbi:MAG: ABC transporter substrate-binding protein, partial [Armatimonadetes bacterium]|nr:ABC transporter substrate-binding protein [Armatimonadota bacterium]
MSTQRIASLVPFATEIVCALGLRESLVAVSHVCDYPPSVKELPAVTAQTPILAPHRETDADGDSMEVPLSAGEIDAAVRSGAPLYTIDTATLRELAPTIIFTQGLCDVCAVSHVATLEAARELEGTAQIVDLSPTNIAGVLDAIRIVGAATGRDAEASELVSDMIARFESVKLSAMESPNHPRVLLLEWPEPLFCAGHWSPELLDVAHAVAAPWDKPGAPSRIIMWNDVLRFDPEVIVL